MPEISAEGGTEEQYIDEHGNMVTKKVYSVFILSKDE